MSKQNNYQTKFWNWDYLNILKLNTVIYILRKAGFESLLVKGESVAKCVTILNE